MWKDIHKFCFSSTNIEAEKNMIYQIFQHSTFIQPPSEGTLCRCDRKLLPPQSAFSLFHPPAIFCDTSSYVAFSCQAYKTKGMLNILSWACSAQLKYCNAACIYVMLPTQGVEWPLTSEVYPHRFITNNKTTSSPS